MPTLLREKGYRFFFFSGDRKEPVHIHVEKAEAYAKLWLNPVMLASSKDFNASELNELIRLTRQHEKMFMERWNEFFK